jgi:dolichol-phosphate mannosyltransferase
VKKKLISIVTPVYNEEGNLDKFYQRIKAVLAKIKYEYEIIFVNDGSKDSSLLVLIRLSETDKHIRIIDFSRNFGHQMAITAGMEHANGDCVVILDSDLQDPPEVIIELIKKWEEGFEVVNAKRRSRSDGFFKDLSAVLFYKFLNSILVNKIPENVGDFRLLDRKCINILKKIKEKDRYLRGLSTWIGFKQTQVEYDRAKREWGKTGYPISKMFGLAFNAVFSFSRLPMKLASILSALFFSITFLVIIYALLSQVFGQTVPGWSSQIIIYSIYLALQMMILAIISEYVGRIYTQVQDRPSYIISNYINFNKKPRD